MRGRRRQGASLRQVCGTASVAFPGAGGETTAAGESAPQRHWFCHHWCLSICRPNVLPGETPPRSRKLSELWSQQQEPSKAKQPHEVPELFC